MRSNIIAAAVILLTGAAVQTARADTTVFFLPGGTGLTKEAMNNIIATASQVTPGAARISITGYADSSSGETPETALRRANSVRDALQSNGISNAEITAVSAVPPADGGLLQRRVTIRVVKASDSAAR